MNKGERPSSASVLSLLLVQAVTIAPVVRRRGGDTEDALSLCDGEFDGNASALRAGSEAPIEGEARKADGGEVDAAAVRKKGTGNDRPPASCCCCCDKFGRCRRGA